MKFLLDMGIAQSTARFLNGQGHDAVHLRQEGLERMKDEDIIVKARTENRVILTHDLDFGRIIALSRAKLPSVITFRLQDMQATNVNRFVSIVIERNGEELINGVLISVSEDTIRTRTLPV